MVYQLLAHSLCNSCSRAFERPSLGGGGTGWHSAEMNLPISTSDLTGGGAEGSTVGETLACKPEDLPSIPRTYVLESRVKHGAMNLWSQGWGGQNRPGTL